MKKLNLLILFSLTSCFLFAQNTISGNIECLAGANMENVTVELTGPVIGTISVLTDADGNYTFNDMPSGEDYIIHAEKDGSILNGITTYDLVLIMKGVLLIQPFDNPFLFLAADINLSGAVTSLDMLLLRQLILSITTTVPEGVWRFATEDFDYNPPAGYVNDIPVTNLQNDVAVNLIGVRFGDINQSAGSCD